MKKYILFSFLLLLSNSVISQNRIDTLLGAKGIYSKLVPKMIGSNEVLTFDLKVTIRFTTLKFNKKPSQLIMYLNTKDGYLGVDRAVNPSKVINENDSNINFIVETLSKQSFNFSTINGVKKGEKMESNLINSYKNLPFKKLDVMVAKPKKYLTNSLIASPYFVDVRGLQKEYTRYCYGTENIAEGKLKSYLGSFGVGFYNISDKTILCVATEHKIMNIEITKIEKVKASFNTAEFKF